MSAATTPSRSPDDAGATLVLSLIADVGPVTHRRLLERFGSAGQALAHAFPPALVRAAVADADRLAARARERGVDLTTSADARYPEQLNDLYDPPPALWSHGDWETLRQPVVAVVGTRRCTAYGRRVTRALVTELARAGACIVSGMAHGIDAVAHLTALETGGRTIAVLGTGPDVAYPAANTGLHRDIGARGLIISELPPGAGPDGGSFPRRNRLIAALASLTIVVEAPLKSGALITARCAMELGRDVGMVPGPIDAPQSQGTNEFVREGAHLISSVGEALSLVGLAAANRRPPVMADDAEHVTWEAIQGGAVTLDDVCARASLPVAQCLAAVTRLELRGVIECTPAGEIRRR